MSGRRIQRPNPLAMLARSRATPKDFGVFYDHLAPSVLAYFMRHTENGDVAYDLMATTFVCAFEARSDFQGTKDAEAAAWLWSIARHELMKYQRSRSVELAALARLGLERPRPSEQELSDLDRLLALERTVRDLLPVAMVRLSPDQQQVIRLRFYEDLTNDEIAERLAISRDVVRARVSRALKTLRRWIPRQAVIETLLDA
jgi:RNA polymerase sigma factor (sigma-70 family)